MLLIDEIDTSLHNKLVEYIIGLFHQSEAAQLIYTTHNTYLLDTNKLRKDQVYFVNKRKDGSSELYSLFDFKDFRENMDLEKAYMRDVSMQCLILIEAMRKGEAQLYCIKILKSSN